MALLFIDPFENGAPGVNIDASLNASLFNMPIYRSSSGYARIVAGKLSNKAVLCYKYATNTISTTFAPLSIPATYSGRITLGFAYSLSNNATNSPSGFVPNVTCIPLSFSSASSSRLIVKPDWSLTLGNLTTSPNTLNESNYSYIEIQVNFLTGEFELFVNNLLVGAGVMTFSGSKYIYFGGINSNQTGQSYQFYDDIYILDDTGTTHNQRLGPVRAVRVPFSSTTEANFTPLGAADNITAINKDGPNTSTFNRSPAANNVGDYFKLDTSIIPSDRPIIAVQQSAMYRKTDIGERALKLVAKDGVDRKEHPLPDRLVTFSGGPAQILETAADGSAWDLTNLAATDFGYEVTE